MVPRIFILNKDFKRPRLDNVYVPAAPSRASQTLLLRQDSSRDRSGLTPSH